MRRAVHAVANNAAPSLLQQTLDRSVYRRHVRPHVVESYVAIGVQEVNRVC